MGMDNVRTFQLRSISVRPYKSAVFEAVRSGNIEGVRKLLASGDLSVRDYAAPRWDGLPHQSLLMVSVVVLVEIYANQLTGFTDCGGIWTL